MITEAFSPDWSFGGGEHECCGGNGATRGRALVRSGRIAARGTPW
jgi:hypothetical protein